MTNFSVFRLTKNTKLPTIVKKVIAMEKTHESAEDYLERILMLEESGVKEIHAVDLASSFGYSKASISVALKKLENGGYVALGPRQQLYLTPDGYKVAKKIYERHQVLTFLLETIGVEKEIALKDACRIEHDLSDETFEALKKCAIEEGLNK